LSWKCNFLLPHCHHRYFVPQLPFDHNFRFLRCHSRNGVSCFVEVTFDFTAVCWDESGGLTWLSDFTPVYWDVCWYESGGWAPATPSGSKRKLILHLFSSVKL
jgi:hypothetical protein